MNRIVLVAVFIAISACATQPEWTWYKPEMTDHYDSDFINDRNECISDSDRMGRNDNLFISCMRKRGWIWSHVDDLPASVRARPTKTVWE